MNDGIIDIRNDNCIDIMKSMKECSVDLILTDPPYGIVTGGDSGNRPKGILSGNRELFKHQNDIKISDWMPYLYRILKDGCHAYIFTNCLNLKDMISEAERSGFLLHNILVWEKNNCTPSQFYMKNCEYVLFFRKGKAKYINNIGSSKTVHKYNNVIGNKTHPCEKPVDLLEFYINNSSKEMDIVLDPFMGTASCGVACIHTNRKFIGIERDKTFYDIAAERLSFVLKNGFQRQLF